MHEDFNQTSSEVFLQNGNLSHLIAYEATIPWTNYSDHLAPTGELENETPYSTAEQILIGIILSVMIFFAIAGNMLVIVAILTDRNLRKTSNYFIVSLAVADTLVASLVMTFAVANDILGFWIFGQVFCNIWLSFDVMCSTASILNLCAISLDRYIHIRSPLHYERRMTPRRTYAALASLWLLSALISFLPIHLGWHRLDQTDETENDHFSCVLSLNLHYAVISSSVSFYIPCFVMVFIYVKLYQYARMHVKNIKRTWATGSTPPISNHSSTTPLEPSRSGQYKLQDHKAAVTLGVIMGTFLLCWVPFFTINIIGAFCGTCIPPVVFAIFTWLGYLNSTMNPVIYSIFNVEFREAFKRVLSFHQCWNRLCQKTDFEFGKPIRTNGTSPSIEYGTVNSPHANYRKTKSGSATDNLLSEKITSV